MFAPLTDYLQKTGKQLRHEGRKIAPQFEDVRIHALRTRFKKLRAVLRFAAAAGSIPDSSGDISKAARSVYKASGAIRDAQVLLLNVSSLQGPSLPRMALWLAGRIAAAQQDWNAVWKKDLLKKQAETLKTLRTTSIPPAALRRYFRTQLKRIHQLAGEPSLNDEQLHDIRKLVKDLQYLLSWSKRYWPEGHAAIRDFPERKVKRLGELAGGYNDLRNAIAALRRYARDEEDDTALHAAGTVLKGWETERMASRERLVKAVGRVG